MLLINIKPNEKLLQFAVDGNMTSLNTVDSTTRPLKKIDFQSQCKEYNTLPCVSHLDEDIFGEIKHGIPPSSITAKWHLGAQLVLVISMLFSGGIGVLVLAISFSGKSKTAFGFAFDSLLDTVTSAIVFWRFFGVSGLEYSRVKEKQACIGIAVCFVLSSFGIFVRTLYPLVQQEVPKMSTTILILSCISCIAFATISWFKFVIGNGLRSISMKTDAFNSAATSAMALGLLVSFFAQQQNNEVWFIDSIVAVSIAFVIFVYGIRLLTSLFFGTAKESEWTFLDGPD